MRRVIVCLFLALGALAAAAQPADRISFNEGWTFEKDGAVKSVTLPHDWGVEGAFKQEYPGESGKLAWWGKAVYRNVLTVTPEDLEKDVDLEIDGAMSHATVEVNGVDLGGWPYGYASFAVRLNPALKAGKNEIVVKLDNPEESSRWYPGGGIYRNVWITKTNKTSVAHWGTFVTTEIGPVDRVLNQADATVALRVTLKHAGEKTVGMVRTRIFRQDRFKRDGEDVVVNRVVAETRSIEYIEDGKTVWQTFDLEKARLWTPDDPAMYVARTTVETPDEVLDTYETPFEEMGCNAIRTSHNPPAPEFLDLCDRMGFLVMDELTDTWTVPKKPHGYAELFEDWAEKDLVALIHRDRNHPSVILWSIGNECGEQGDSTKWWIPQMLTDICHREDPSRPTSAGNDNPWAAGQGYARTIDTYGFNYKPHQYAQFVKDHPGQPVFGSETASCISTRGYYRFPVEQEKGKGWTMDAPFQVSSYDLYAPGWASKPDYEWEYEDQVPECAGEFVWTGYDYLGEPTPFNMDPSVLTNFHTEEEKEAFKKMVAGWGQTIADVPLPSRTAQWLLPVAL